VQLQYAKVLSDYGCPRNDTLVNSAIGIQYRRSILKHRHWTILEMKSSVNTHVYIFLLCSIYLYIGNDNMTGKCNYS